MITFEIHPDLDITFVSKEFTSFCPFDGKPDSYELTINYITNGLTVESKSLSEWLLTFRDKKLSCEDLTEILANELNSILNPKQITVILKQSIRDSLQLTVKTNKEN